MVKCLNGHQNLDAIDAAAPPIALEWAPPSIAATQPPVTTKGTSGQRQMWFVLVGLALLAVTVCSCGGSSSDSSSFCADFLKLYDGPQGVGSAIIAVDSYDRGTPNGGGGMRPPGWSDSDLQTAAKNAKTLAAEAPSDKLKTDFTNIADTLSASATGDYNYHGTGNESLDVNGSTAVANCRLHTSSGH